jgi:deoxyadenosine/deoxycytidine kinase
MHYEKGTMSEVDYETYTSLFDAMVMSPYFPAPDLLIYLEGTFDEVVERIKERGRPMEQQTPIEYWKEMNQRYENWINNFNACPVLRLNITEYDLLKDDSSVEDIVKKIGTVLNHSQKYMKSR